MTTIVDGGPWKAQKLDELEVIWNTITRGVARFEGESGISTINSKLWRQIDERLEELAALLVQEVHDSHPDEKRRTELDYLNDATQDIWRNIHDRLIEFALAVEARRAQSRYEAAAAS